MTAESGMNLDELVAQLGSKDGTKRQEARSALVKTGFAATPQLLDVLESDQRQLRWEAAKSLVEIADPATAERLVAALADNDSDVQWVVGEALIALGRDALPPLLAELTHPNRSHRIFEGSHHVLHELAKRHNLGSVLDPVLAAFKQSEPEVAVPVAANTALNRENS